MNPEFNKKISQYIWAEKYRPLTLQSFLGSDEVKEKIKRFIEQKDFPHLLFYGSAGGGKTSLAKILVNSIDCDHLYINASDERGIDTIRDKIVGFAATIAFKPLRVIILDEADYLPALSQAALRNVMETYSTHTRFILTCNYVERITPPILSRCGGGLKIEPPTMAEVATLLVTILEAEKIGYTLKEIEFIIKNYYPDIRKVINFSQTNVTANKLVIGVDNVVETDYKEKLISLLRTPSKPGIFTEIRQLIANASFSNYDEVYSYLYEKVDFFALEKAPQVILELADAIYQSALVFEKEITFVAMMKKILDILK